MGGSPGESEQGEMGPEEQRLGALGMFSLWDVLGWLNAGTSFGGVGCQGHSVGGSCIDTREQPGDLQGRSRSTDL